MTFGYTSKGPYPLQFPTPKIAGSWFTGAAGKLTAITVYIEANWSGNKKVNVAIYKKSDNSLVAQATEQSLSDTTDDWITFDFPDIDITAQDYFLVVLNEDNIYYYGAVESGKSGSQTQVYGDFPATWSPVSDFIKYSIYATYTPTSVSQIKKVSGVAIASVKKISGVAIASVKKVAGVSNV